MYVSWRLDVTRGGPDRGRSLVVPNCWYRLHKASTVFSVQTKLSCNISMTLTSFNHAYGAPSVSFFQPWNGVSKTFFKIILGFCFTGINTMLVHMFSRQTCLRFDCRPKKKKKNMETKTSAKQTNCPCNSCTDQCKWPGWIHDLPM